MKNWALLLGSGFGFLGVGLGAFGAHALEAVLMANGREATWETAVLYQFVHSGLLLWLGILAGQSSSPRLPLLATWLSASGIVLFSGSLYLLSVTGFRWLGAITPIGGVCFLAAWTLVFIHSLQPTTRT
ncbi:MAG: hypothetical protein RLZZ165_973 [Bacteroidota bacterium]|jgi:uncharacterized membrane protein YgdD (TMEM256/DUF423 family)